MKRISTLMFTLLLGSALAQGASPVTLEAALYLVKTVTVDGKATEQLTASPKSVFPGDLIRQEVTARNTGSKPLKDVVVRLPVPKSTVYVAPEKALENGAVRTQYSIDGGKTFAAAPLKKTITVTENGKSVQKEVEVKPNEYNAVRWIIGTLAPGENLKLGYRIQVK